MKINLDNIYFIMVEPRTPGNIGAAARALKTMGFRNLELVNPCDHLCAEARWMAHASEDLLENAALYSTLPDALSDKNFVVATTQRIRGYHFPFFTPKELGDKFAPISREHKAAIVFGRERTGLTNEEIRCCHAISTIPAAVDHPSLNLSQAVMLYASELFGHSYGGEKEFEWELAGYEELESLYQRLEKSLRQTDFVPRDSWEMFMMRFRRIFGRAVPEKRDVKLMHKVIQAYDLHIKKIENENGKD